MKFVTLKIAVLTGLSLLNLSTVHAASLSYFENTPEGVAWKWFSAKTKAISIVHTFKEKPSALYWEQDNKRILVLKDKQILTFDHNGPVVSGVQGIALPPLAKDEKTVGLWRDKDTKRLRIATSYLVPGADIGGTIENPVLKDRIGMEINGLAKPEWGSHAILKIYEFVLAERKWNVIEALPTKTEAGDTPGMSVLKPFWTEEGASGIKLTSSKYCARYGVLYRGRQCHLGNDSQTRKAFFKKAFPQCKLSPEGYVLGRGCPIEGVGKVSCEVCKFELLHSSIEGDSLHAALPLYLKNKMTGEMARIQLKNQKREQVLIDQNGVYAMIEVMRVPDHIYVLDLNTGEMIFDTLGENSIWFPND
ncbi:MAG: hypothetical protein JKY92_08180 [Magnetovibrio sp.]|nr:hypothetical protein [Magnetovibrio sp.]